MSDFLQHMQEYVDRSYQSSPCVPDGVRELIRVSQAVEPEPDDEWHELESPVRLRKRYRLGDRGKVLPFIEMLMEYEDQMQHHASITVEGSDVTVEVRTHDAEYLTAEDHNYTAQADAILIDLDDGYGDYMRDDEEADYVGMAEDFRDRRSVGYTDGTTAYDF